MQITVGSRIGHYEVSARLGAGGMGEVYRARDTSLERDVAIKVLPEAFANEPERLARFDREAKLLASLNHPNIAAIYGLQRSEDTQALVLELVEGPTLADRIEQGPIPIAEASSIARQIAEALEAAHQAGVIHRDLKPANVKVRADGTVKVLDFGLAKRIRRQLTPDAETDRLLMVTEAGMLLGTFPYMAPEQLRGLPADERSDVWAFGALLYELVGGKRPFGGSTGAELSSAILHEPPPPLPSTVPARWRAAIERCLAKAPDQRYQHPHEVADALSGGGLSAPLVWALTRHRRRVAAAAGVIAVASATAWMLGGGPDTPGPSTPTVPVQSMAVLPLDNLSGDPEQEYFVAGMTDALTSGLGRLGGLKVISRQSASRYRETDKPLPEIAAELGVDFIVEGSVLRAGDRVRVTVELVRGETDASVWSDSYEREVADVLSVQADVASAVAREIDVALTPGEVTLLSSNRTVDPETYEAYLRGMFRIHEGRFDEGIAFLQEAVALDPADPLAYSGLALGYANLGHGPGNPHEAFPRARAAAVRALELDDTMADAHLALADVSLYYDWEWETAGRAFRRSLELNPSSAEARYHYGWYLDLLGREDEAIAELRRAEELDPLTPKYSAWVGGWYACCTDQIDTAVSELTRSLALHPDSALVRRNLAVSYARQGRLDDALASHQEAVARNPAEAVVLGLIYASAGRPDEARRLAVELEAAGAPAFISAQIHAELDDHDEAFRLLEVAYEEHFWAFPWIDRFFVFRSLRDDPRFEELLRELGLAG